MYLPEWDLSECLLQAWHRRRTPQFETSLTITGSSELGGQGRIFPIFLHLLPFPTRAVYCTGQHAEAVRWKFLWASEKTGIGTRKEILEMMGFQEVGEASRWPSRLLSSGPYMASRVFKGNKKLLDSSRSWS